MRTLDARPEPTWGGLADVTHVWDRIAPARAALAADDETVLRDQVALSMIPAPTGDESGRAHVLVARFRALGLGDVQVDAVGNVLARRGGATGEAPIVVCAHL